MLRMLGVEKRYADKPVLRGVDLDVIGGEVLALLGENGAGKSTLMNVLAGVVKADRGRVSIDGAEVELRSPRDGMRLGIGMVHQHDAVIDALSVAENLAVSRPGGPRIDPKSMRAAALDDARRAGVELPDPDRRAATLGVGERQRIEFVRALRGGARILILDEPTAALAPAEAERMLATVVELKRRGVGVVFITHRLAEVEAVADRVVVLRAGSVVGVQERSRFDPDQLTTWMVGESAPSSEVAVEPSASSSPTPVLEVDDLSAEVGGGASGLRGVSFAVAGGEVVGIAGVDGNGQRALIDCLCGLQIPTVGAARIGGRPLLPGRLGAARALGMAIVPGDRHREGLALALTVRDNLLLSTQALNARGRSFHARRADRATDPLRRFGVPLDRLDDPVGQLSGGNQQRVVLARELAETPRLLLLAQPTRGLDVSATRFVHDEVRRARRGGCAVLLVSSDLDEVLALSDRVLVMSRGRIAAELPRGADRRVIGRAMAGDGR